MLKSLVIESDWSKKGELALS